MGISYCTAKILCDARQSGASFRHMLTVGRQTLALHPPELRKLRRAFDPQGSSSVWRALAKHLRNEYADRFYRDFLGNETLDVLDLSSYEGATITHDLNCPVPESLWNRFDAVIDGGSLEHVFNFPVAIESLMRMTKLGGSIFLINPANNLCGHGFYQFSPELMFRIFSAEHGFDLKQVLLLQARFPCVERLPARKAYRVKDPASVHERVGLMSRHPVMMVVEAKRISEQPPFATAPQQSDYLEKWAGAVPGPATNTRRLRHRILASLPWALRQRILGHMESCRSSLLNTRFYTQV